jgi:hypothetical protein
MAVCTECKPGYTAKDGKCEKDDGMCSEFRISDVFIKFYFSYPPPLLFLPPPPPPKTVNTSASTSSCNIGCIIGIVLAILGAIILSIVVVLVVYAVYRYLSNPATKLAKAGTEGLNG